MVLEAHTWQGGGGGQDAPYLGVRCTQAEDIDIEVYISWVINIGSGTDNRFPISYRLDDQPIVETEWWSSTARKSAFLLYDNAGRDFWQGLYDHSEVAVKVTYYTTNNFTGVWKLHGAWTAFQEIRRKCDG